MRSTTWESLGIYEIRKDPKSEDWLVILYPVPGARDHGCVVGRIMRVSENHWRTSAGGVGSYDLVERHGSRREAMDWMMAFFGNTTG